MWPNFVTSITVREAQNCHMSHNVNDVSARIINLTLLASFHSVTIFQMESHVQILLFYPLCFSGFRLRFYHVPILWSYPYPMAPARIWKGHTSGAMRHSRRKFFSCPSTFCALPVYTISCFGEHCHDGQYSLVSFLFAAVLLTVPTCPAICKSGGPFPVPYMESASVPIPIAYIFSFYT